MLLIPAIISLLQATALVTAAHTNLARSVHARHAVLAQKRAPVPIPAPVPNPIKKRGSNKKCRARPSSTSIPPSSSPVAPVNPGADPNPSPQSQVTTTHHAAPTTTNPPHSTPKPSPSPTHTHQQPAPSPPSGGGSSSGGGSGGGDSGPLPGTHTGDLTFYELGLTACGNSFTDQDHVAAVSHLLFDGYPGATANPNENPLCGRRVNINYQGRTTSVTIQDRCTGCAYFDLDLSPAAFDDVGSEATGRLHGATWSFA